MLLQALSGNSLIFHQTQCLSFLVSRDNITIILVDCIATLLVFDHLKFQEFLFTTLQSRNAGVKSVGTKVDLSEKYA